MEKEYKVQEHLHYAGIPSWNHCEITQDVEGADIVVLGVPFDSAVTFRPGARFAPRAVREQSLIACCFKYPWDYYLGDEAKVIDYGDVGYWVGAYATDFMVKDTYETVKKVLDAGASPMTIGGDHTIPYGPVRACAEKFGKLSLIHFTLIRTAPQASAHQKERRTFPTQTLHMTFRKKDASILPSLYSYTAELNSQNVDIILLSQWKLWTILRQSWQQRSKTS